MSQPKAHSIIETVTNTAIGYGINFVANLLVLPLFGYKITVSDNLLIGVIYTFISIARSYALRRLFNRWHR